MNDLDLSNTLRSVELKRVILSPAHWKRLKLPAVLTWTTQQVATTPPTNIPATKRGVYTFVVQPGIAGHPHCSYLLYVGQAAGENGFRARYRTYLYERTVDDTNRPLVNRMVKTWYDHLWFSYAEVPDDKITVTEDELIKAFLPPINAKFPADITKALKAF